MAAPPKTGPFPVEGNRRRSDRVPIVMRVTLISNRNDGIRVREEVESEVISEHGALLRSKRSLPVTGDITLFNPRNNMKVEARVISAGQVSADGYARFAVEFRSPCKNFWGIWFPPSDVPIPVTSVSRNSRRPAPVPIAAGEKH